MINNNINKIHIIGVGGAACSYLAGWLHEAGYEVTGCDLTENERVKFLKNRGIKIYIGHSPKHLGGVDWLIYTNAISEKDLMKHPEISYAIKTGIKVSRHGVAAGEIIEPYKTIAVAGAHGKTTTTMMVSEILEKSGLDPNYFVGEGIYRYGKGKYFVIEACEYRNMFLAYHPDIVIVTNIEFDHPDCFKGIKDVVNSFKKFVDNIREGGTLIACVDSEPVLDLLEYANKKGINVQEYGSKNILKYKPVKWGSVSYVSIGEKRINLRLNIPGKHNLLNAIGAIYASCLCGIDEGKAAKILEKYKSVKRRLEILGEIKGTMFITDWAHHPDQIKVVLQTLREQYSTGKILAFYEPHQYERTMKLMDRLSRGWDKVDKLYLLPIYKATGRESMKALKTVSSEKLAREIRKNGFNKVEVLARYDDIDKNIESYIGKVSAIVFLNAGPLDGYIRTRFNEWCKQST